MQYQQADSPTTNAWSDESLFEKIKTISEGSLVIGERDESQSDKEITSGYRGTTSTATEMVSAYPITREILPNLSTPVNQVSNLEPPVFSSAASTTTSFITSDGSYSTLKPITRYASFAQDDSALTQPAIAIDGNASNSAVAPAAYQGGLVMPGLDPAANQQPSLASPSTGFAQPPSLPSSSSVIPNATTTVPSTTVPAPSFGSTTVPPSYGSSTVPPTINQGTTSTVPYDLPQYRTAPIVTGEPFVTEGPCQFDAAYMVTPAYPTMQNNQCGPYLPGYQTAPATTSLPGYYAPPTVMPNQVPSLYASNNAGHRPLLGFGQENYNVQIGRGIIGQPVAYVPGQTFRNFLRYIFP